ncbi:MAG: hypothetical protein A2Z95_07195 [Gallionellales bacterium GWA2_60_18]|nr:MAG: hypothetical protein A2Z95_07195 [Gallionellales bacterium GWA2_60_18]
MVIVIGTFFTKLIPILSSQLLFKQITSLHVMLISTGAINLPQEAALWRSVRGDEGVLRAMNGYSKYLGISAY